MTHPSPGRLVWLAALFLVLFAGISSPRPWTLLAQAPGGTDGPPISQEEVRRWVTHLASDRLQGRQAFTEGYGLAAQYVAGHLDAWGLKPLGPDGSFLQPVGLRGYRVTRNSSVTVEVKGTSTTFTHGEHVTFGANAGGPQTLTFDSAEFVGYGLPADYDGRDVKGRLVVTIPNLAPAAGRGRTGGAPAGGRGGTAGAIAAGAASAVAFAPAADPASNAEQALAQAQAALTQAAAAVVQAQQALRGGRGGPAAAGARGAQPPDVTSVRRIDALIAPQFTGNDTFFEALFAGTSVPFADVRARAQKGESIAPIALPARVTITIDHTYEPISQQVTHNVVGLVEGSDPVLKDTYVLFGAHLDHVGYSQTTAGRGGGTDACRRRSPAAQAAVTAAGRVVQRPDAGRGGAPPPAAASAAPAPALPFDERDVISNGADDNGSGSAALMAIAKAFAQGPRPKRSVVFVWHTAEESGLYGSRYNADFPVVPNDRVQAHINMDMVGRDDCNNIEGDYTNAVFVVGADRISTDLHNVIVETNRTLREPLTLDFELNDVDDPENVYTRSDHFSYAEKGIPVAFFTTGLHPDYHRVSDTVDRITFPKLARIAELAYRSGIAIANSDRALERDNRGSRTGFGSAAEILRK